MQNHGVDGIGHVHDFASAQLCLGGGLAFDLLAGEPGAARCAAAGHAIQGHVEAAAAGAAGLQHGLVIASQQAGGVAGVAFHAIRLQALHHPGALAGVVGVAQAGRIAADAGKHRAGFGAAAHPGAPGFAHAVLLKPRQRRPRHRHPAAFGLGDGRAADAGRGGRLGGAAGHEQGGGDPGGSQQAQRESDVGQAGEDGGVRHGLYCSEACLLFWQGRPLTGCNANEGRGRGKGSAATPAMRECRLSDNFFHEHDASPRCRSLGSHAATAGAAGSGCLLRQRLRSLHLRYL